MTPLSAYAKSDYSYQEHNISFTIRPDKDEQVTAYHIDVKENGSYFYDVYRSLGNWPRSADGLYIGSTTVGDQEISCVIIIELERLPKTTETINLGRSIQGQPLPANLWRGTTQVLSSIDHFCANNYDPGLSESGGSLHDEMKNSQESASQYSAQGNHHVVGLLITGEFPDRDQLLGMHIVRYIVNGKRYQKKCPIIFLEDRNPQFEYSFRNLIGELQGYAPEILR